MGERRNEKLEINKVKPNITVGEGRSEWKGRQLGAKYMRLQFVFLLMVCSLISASDEISE